MNVRSIHCSCYLISTFFLAGLVQTWWLRSPRARWLAIPIDGGATLRGRRWFGENKTWRGLFMMPAAVGVAFLLVAYVPTIFGWPQQSPWPASATSLFLLGIVAGLGYMLGELPNSLVKRQLGIEAGDRPMSRGGQVVCFLCDQLDSVMGALLATALLVPIPRSAFILLLIVGPVVHWVFNCLLKWLGVKSRAS